jgi:membrane-associated phospholipid phosphatase
MQLHESRPEQTRTGSVGPRQLIRRLAQIVSARGVLYLTALIGIVLVAILSEAGGEVYEAVTEHDGVAQLDQPALNTALAWRSPALDKGITFFTHLGGPLGMTIIASAITALMVWRWRSRTPLVLMLIAVTGSLLLTTLGKTNFGRTRPPTSEAVPPFETSPSFPSGHALNSTVIAGVVAYLVFRRLERRLARFLTIGLALLWAVAIGLSRVYLGHHWLTDVMFGWLVGLAWLTVVIVAHRLYLSVWAERSRSRPR